jgi:hypothetical protein
MDITGGQIHRNDKKPGPKTCAIISCTNPPIKLAYYQRQRAKTINLSVGVERHRDRLRCRVLECRCRGGGVFLEKEETRWVDGVE